MAQRFLFLCPDHAKASGGIAVLYDATAALREAGYDACMLHLSPGFRYPDAPADVPTLYDDTLRRALFDHVPRRAKPLAWARLWIDRLRGGPNPRWQPDTDRDVLVVPEFLLAYALAAYPEARIWCFNQNPFAFVAACDQAWQRGLDPVGRVELFLGMADICMRSMAMVGAENVAFFPVAPKLDAFPFRAEKAAKIAYMPRKRPQEARLIAQALQRRGAIEGYDLVAIDGMPHSEVQRLIGESLIFISLLKEESLGFPAAEAMAAGCITIGYTGLGADAFFDESTGFPIPEGDTARLVSRVEEVVARYGRDPAPLDALRQHAAEAIRVAYPPEAFRAGLLETWRKHALDP